MNFHYQGFAATAPKGRAGYVCWTRMQAEAGQGLASIVERKELERRAGNGLFFWGVGSAPSTMTQPLARIGIPIPVIFSLMKSPPKKADTDPSGILAWNGYIDCRGAERDVPEHVLLTSRSETGRGPKKAHFALICHSDEPLVLSNDRPFNHRSYRNAGVSGAPVGASQVTALLEPSDQAAEGPAEYVQSMRAQLAGSYWVKLTRPSPADPNLVSSLPKNLSDYLEAVQACRNCSPALADTAGFLL